MTHSVLSKDPQQRYKLDILSTYRQEESSINHLINPFINYVPLIVINHFVIVINSTWNAHRHWCDKFDVAIHPTSRSPFPCLLKTISVTHIIRQFLCSLLVLRHQRLCLGTLQKWIQPTIFKMSWRILRHHQLGFHKLSDTSHPACHSPFDCFVPNCPFARRLLFLLFCGNRLSWRGIYAGFSDDLFQRNNISKLTFNHQQKSFMPSIIQAIQLPSLFQNTSQLIWSNPISKLPTYYLWGSRWHFLAYEWA